MRYLPIILFTLVFGAACGGFQYWMAMVLDRKRWLLLLQPGLFALAAGCFWGWTITIEKLANAPERFAAAPFAVLLIFTLVGWFIAARRKRKK